VPLDFRELSGDLLDFGDQPVASDTGAGDEGSGLLPTHFETNERRCMTMRWSLVDISVLLGMSLGLAGAEDVASSHPYSGDFLTRSTFTGDFNGDRNDLAAKGITFDANLTQIEQGVVGGGKNGSWE
jgi:hypothetical protein